METWTEQENQSYSHKECPFLVGRLETREDIGRKTLQHGKAMAINTPGGLPDCVVRSLSGRITLGANGKGVYRVKNA